MIWPAIIIGSLGAYLLKLSGYVIPERVLDNERLRRLTALLPVALLAALVAVQTFSTGTQLQLDARIAGLAAAIVALALAHRSWSWSSLPRSPRQCYAPPAWPPKARAVRIHRRVSDSNNDAAWRIAARARLRSRESS